MVLLLVEVLLHVDILRATVMMVVFNLMKVGSCQIFLLLVCVGVNVTNKSDGKKYTFVVGKVRLK